MKDPRVEAYQVEPPTSLTLLARVRADDQAAWTRLVDLYAPLVYRWGRRSGLRNDDASDLGQEVFIAVARAIRDFRRDRPGDTFRGWLYTITKNKLRDRTRSPIEVGVGGSDRGPLDRLADAADDEESAIRSDRALLMRRAVELIRDDFETRTWAAFWRTAVEGHDPETVARELGMTRAAVYIAKSRVRARLKNEFGDLLELGPTVRLAANES